MFGSNQFLLSTSPWVDADILGSGNILSDDDQSFIEGIGEAKNYKKGTSIFEFGNIVNNFYFLKKGMVRYALLSLDGAEKPVCYVSPGCFFGEEQFFHSQPIICNIDAIEDVEAISIDKRYTWSIISRPTLTYTLLKSISLKTRLLATQVEDLAFRNTIEKVCRLLYCVLHKLSRSADNSSIKLTHQELAALAGVHRVTVTNTLSQLKREGVIRIRDDGTIVVNDWEELRKYGFGS